MLNRMHWSALLSLGGRPRRWLWVALALFLAGDPLWTFVWFPRQSRDRVCEEDALPVTHAPVLILGAAVTSSREPTQVLEARLETALRLYHAGKVKWFLVSGDNRAVNYNEPMAMKRWLVRHDVPLTRIVSDFAGRRTHDSLKRARAVFGVRRVVVVTSDFHLPRALFIARHLGMEAWGVPASTEAFGWNKRLGFWAREYLARHLAYLDFWFPPDTLLGPREPTPDDWLTEPPEHPAS
ncbi:MAG TPA: ElyC/SanA/YdcF family protein [Holophaga sp.]|nr:ElyC/SanA/YdcF family protein [Holophaga sp.]HPS66389.1 ElyC/SanA/YdcF family protein [Holophaga sp.]